MIYRIVAETQPERWIGPLDEETAAGLPRGPLAGVWTSGLAGGDRWDEDLIMPHLQNPKARFWFTEAGWRRYGAPLAARIRDQGVPFTVLREKNPSDARVVYRDRWQVALLPPRPEGRAE